MIGDYNVQDYDSALSIFYITDHIYNTKNLSVRGKDEMV